MKARWIVLGLLVVGLGWAATASAGQKSSKADDKPDPAGGSMPVRHGVAYDGCSHFELRDQDAFRAWAESNAMAFAKYVLALDDVKANPEPLLIDMFSLLFPECQWPPPPSTTFSPEKIDWATAVQRVKGQIGQIDMAASDGQWGGAPVMVLDAITRHFGGRR